MNPWLMIDAWVGAIARVFLRKAILMVGGGVRRQRMKMNCSISDLVG